MQTNSVENMNNGNIGTNRTPIEKNWAEIKGKIKARWSKFNDDEVEGFKKDLSQLSGKVQKTYGIAKDHADHQYEEFRKSVQSLLGKEDETPATPRNGGPTVSTHDTLGG